jgi:molybdopterin-guanine dinucleotide biosynthesis protein B
LAEIGLKKRVAVAFTGPSNSGKTTLIEKLAKLLIDNLKKDVVIVKNDPKDKAVFDVEGKDSDKFFKSGADVFVVSPTRTTLFSHKNSEIEQLIKMRGDFDYLLVEGLKTLPLPRIAIFRNSVDEKYFSYIEAVAIDDTIDKNSIPEGVEILDLNSPDQILQWIDKNGAEV